MAEDRVWLYTTKVSCGSWEDNRTALVELVAHTKPEFTESTEYVRVDSKYLSKLREEVLEECAQLAERNITNHEPPLFKDGVRWAITKITTAIRASKKGSNKV